MIERWTGCQPRLTAALPRTRLLEPRENTARFRPQNAIASSADMDCAGPRPSWAAIALTISPSASSPLSTYMKEPAGDGRLVRSRARRHHRCNRILARSACSLSVHHNFSNKAAGLSMGLVKTDESDRSTKADQTNEKFFMALTACRQIIPLRRIATT